MNTTKILCKYFDSEKKGHVVLGDIFVPYGLIISFSYLLGGQLHSLLFLPETIQRDGLEEIFYCLNPHHAIPGALILIGIVILLAIILSLSYRLGKITLAGLRFISKGLNSLYNIRIAECPHQSKNNNIKNNLLDTEETTISTKEFYAKMYPSDSEETK